jgi:hypothetical protein
MVKYIVFRSNTYWLLYKSTKTPKKIIKKVVVFFVACVQFRKITKINVLYPASYICTQIYLDNIIPNFLSVFIVKYIVFRPNTYWLLSSFTENALAVAANHVA